MTFIITDTTSTCLKGIREWIASGPGALRCLRFDIIFMRCHNFRGANI